MKPISTIFFDWGGVIADDPGDDFLMSLLRQIGATAAQAQEIYDGTMRRFMTGEISEIEYWQRLRDEYGFTIPDTISEEFKAWRGLAKNEAVLDLVHEAKSRGYTVALLTNVIEPTYNVLQAEGCYEPFDAIIASCKVGYAKPDPAIYRIALQQLDATPETSLFIEDKPKNIAPATQLGFQTILAENSAQIIRDVRKYL
ncbi:MAG: HAD family phosphatase [Candidatus Saccharimonadales bacterium]